MEPESQPSNPGAEINHADVPDTRPKSPPKRSPSAKLLPLHGTITKDPHNEKPLVPSILPKRRLPGASKAAATPSQTPPNTPAVHSGPDPTPPNTPASVLSEPSPPPTPSSSSAESVSSVLSPGPESTLKDEPEIKFTKGVAIAVEAEPSSKESAEPESLAESPTPVSEVAVESAQQPNESSESTSSEVPATVSPDAEQPEASEPVSVESPEQRSDASSESSEPVQTVVPEVPPNTPTSVDSSTPTSSPAPVSPAPEAAAAEKPPSPKGSPPTSASPKLQNRHSMVNLMKVVRKPNHAAPSPPTASQRGPGELPIPKPPPSTIPKSITDDDAAPKIAALQEVYQIRPEDIDAARRIFNTMDINGDGVITLNDFIRFRFDSIHSKLQDRARQFFAGEPQKAPSALAKLAISRAPTSPRSLSVSTPNQSSMKGSVSAGAIVPDASSSLPKAEPVEAQPEAQDAIPTTEPTSESIVPSESLVNPEESPKEQTTEATSVEATDVALTTVPASERTTESSEAVPPVAAPQESSSSSSSTGTSQTQDVSPASADLPAPTSPEEPSSSSNPASPVTSPTQERGGDDSSKKDKEKKNGARQLFAGARSKSQKMLGGLMRSLSGKKEKDKDDKRATANPS